MFVVEFRVFKFDFLSGIKFVFGSFTFSSLPISSLLWRCIADQVIIFFKSNSFTPFKLNVRRFGTLLIIVIFWFLRLSNQDSICASSDAGQHLRLRLISTELPAKSIRSRRVEKYVRRWFDWVGQSEDPKIVSVAHKGNSFMRRSDCLTWKFTIDLRQLGRSIHCLI